MPAARPFRNGGDSQVEAINLQALTFDSARHLDALRPFLSQPRETLPQLTLAETRKAMAWAGSRLGLEVIESKSNTPSFVALPGAGKVPQVTLFGSWHAESMPVVPAAVDGSERLALAATMGALDALVGNVEAALIVAPAA